MKNRCVVVGWVVLLVAGGMAWAEPDAPTNVATDTLTQIAKQAISILERERIHDWFDWYRKMKAFGVTYQPRLMAPNDLVGRLSNPQLRMYAGVKLVDALYAMSFLKWQEATDCMSTIDDIQSTLQLRSYADLKNNYIRTLRNASNNPGAQDLPRLIEQLASDYVSDLPALLSSAVTADSLIESLYGMAIEMAYITGGLWTSENAMRLQDGFNQLPTFEIHKMVLSLFYVFGRRGDIICIGGESEEKLTVIQSMYDLENAEYAGRMTCEDAEPGWIAAKMKIQAIRASILTPSTPDL